MGAPIGNANASGSHGGQHGTGAKKIIQSQSTRALYREFGIKNPQLKRAAMARKGK